MHLTLTAVLSLIAQGQPPAPESPKAPPAEMQAQQPPAPGVPVLEVGGNKIALYGIIRLDAYWGNARVNHNQFTYFAQSHDPAVTPGVHDRDNWIDWTPRMSRLGVRVNRDSLPFWEAAKVAGVFEFDFQNRATTETIRESESRELPRLRHAYLKLTADEFSFLAGQTWDLISPLWPMSNFDGMMWNAGNLGDRRPQIRFGWDRKVFDDTVFNAAVALARTGAIDREDLDADGFRDGDESAKPMVQGRIGLAALFDKRVDLGVWGHIGWEETQFPVAGEDEFTTTSVGVDLKIKLTDNLSLAGEFWKGKNLNDLRGGIDQGVNATTGDEIESTGGWAEAAFTWDRFTISLGAAVDDPKNEDLNNGQRSKNVAPFVTAKVDFGGGFAFGLEWIRWETEYKNVDDGEADRYVFWAAYSF